MPLICLGCSKNFGHNRRAYAGHIYRCSAFQDFQQQTLNAFTLIPEEPQPHDAHDAEGIHENQVDAMFFHGEGPDRSHGTGTGPGLTIVIPPVCNYISIHLISS